MPIILSSVSSRMTLSVDCSSSFFYLSRCLRVRVRVRVPIVRLSLFHPLEPILNQLAPSGGQSVDTPICDTHARPTLIFLKIPCQISSAGYTDVFRVRLHPHASTTSPSRAPVLLLRCACLAVESENRRALRTTRTRERKREGERKPLRSRAHTTPQRASR